MKTTAVSALFAETSTLRTTPFGKPLDAVVDESIEGYMCLTFVNI